MASTVAKSEPLEMDGARLVRAPLVALKAARRRPGRPRRPSSKSPPTYTVEPLLEKVIALTCC